MILSAQAANFQFVNRKLSIENPRVPNLWDTYGFCAVFSIDNALSLWLNKAAGWKHLAPGGVPGST